MTSKVDLKHALQSRSWVKRDSPFSFVTARDVFRVAIYEELVKDFRAILARGLSDSGTIGNQFTRGSIAYDAYSYVLSPSEKNAFSIFMSREWHDVIAGIFGLVAPAEVSLALHHHKKGGISGRPHNDLNPGWFPDVPEGTSINVHDPKVNSYPTGKPFAAGTTTHESTRAIALLYYLDNPGWKRGDGGETGLYRSVSDAADAPAFPVAPIDNTLVAFECSPWSYHGYMENPGRPRNSLVMWLHRPKAEVVQRWGEESIVGWKA
jgi:hypothetical protein